MLITSIQQEGTYLVKVSDRILYTGEKFNPNQSWLSDSEYQNLMGWHQVQVEFFSIKVGD